MPEGVELKVGRTLAVTFAHGEDFITGLNSFCARREIRYGYIPMFVGGFRHTDIVGTCDRVPDPEAPIWSPVHLEICDAVGAGTIAYDEVADRVSAHIHVSVGLRHHGATGHTSHLLSATVQYLTELVIVEVLSPGMRRLKNPMMYGVPELIFDPD